MSYILLLPFQLFKMSRNTKAAKKLQEVKVTPLEGSTKISRLPPSKLRHIAKRTKRYVISRSTGKRKRDINVRCPEGDHDADGDMCSVSPFLFTNSQGSLRQEHQQLLSKKVEQF